jgi:hypothetical protein
MNANAFRRFEERPGALHAAQKTECIVGAGAERASLTTLEAFCDLACFGLVAGVTPVNDKTGPGLSRAGTPAEVKRVRFIDATPDRAADLPNYCMSATARAVAARLSLPLVNTHLLALMALADRLPDDEQLLVSLPSSQPKPFLDRLKPHARAIVIERISVLREHRRIALGLPVRSSDDWLDRQIDRAFIFPMARQYLGRCVGSVAQRIHFHRADEADPAPAHEIALGKFKASDPLGQNVFALVMRRLFFRKPSLQAGLWFDVNPFMLGRRVARLGGETPRGAGEAMLAALQIDFLEAAQAPPQPARS